jgi:putrescine transport system permease protein
LDPRVNTVAALTILVVTIAVVLSSLHMARKERLRQKEISAAFKHSIQYSFIGVASIPVGSK